jgi:hypothetical protein
MDQCVFRFNIFLTLQITTATHNLPTVFRVPYRVLNRCHWTFIVHHTIMPPKKKRTKKHRRKKIATAVETVVDTKENIIVAAAEEARQNKEKEIQSRLLELNKRWKLKMSHYVRFVALGRGTSDTLKRRRRAAYLMASGQSARDRRRAITTSVKEQEKAFPLAFKVLTPQYQMYPNEMVINTMNSETLKSIHQKLVAGVGPPLICNPDGTIPFEKPPDSATTPASSSPVTPSSKSTVSANSDVETPETLAKETSPSTSPTPAAFPPQLPTPSPPPPAEFGLSLFYTPPNSVQRRRLETESEWRWALKDFHKRRNSLSIKGVQSYSNKVLKELKLTRDSEAPVGQIVESMCQIWQFAQYSDAHQYISTEEINILCHHIAQHRKTVTRSMATGTLWAFAYNHHLRVLTHQSKILVETLTDPRFLTSLNGFADGDKESVRLHTHIFGLVATVLAEGSLSKDDLLGDGGTALLGSYLRVAPGGATTPQGTRMAAQALLDSCVRSVTAQYRMGKASNVEVVAQAEKNLADAADAAEKQAALGQEPNAGLLRNVTTNEIIVAKVNIVAVVGKALNTIKDSETFKHILDLSVIFSRSPSEELREAFALTTTSAGYSVAASLLGILSDVQQGINQYQGIPAQKANELMLRVLAALWGVLESTTRSKKAFKRASKAQQLLPGIASPIDVATDMINLARVLASKQNPKRGDLIVMQQAYCAISCVMCLVGPIYDSSMFQASSNVGTGGPVDPDSMALQLFADLSELYDEAKEVDSDRDSTTPTPLQSSGIDITVHGNGWASVRRRTACTMAILTSNSISLCQNLSAAGYFERLVAQVEEEQMREKQRRKTAGRKGAAAAAAAATSTTENGMETNIENTNTTADNAAVVMAATTGPTNVPEQQEPTGCEWLLRALANMAGTESERPLVTSVIETCCRLLEDPTSRKSGVVRQVGPGLDSVVLMLWRLARRFKDHRMSMMLDGIVVTLLRDAAQAAMKAGKLETVESILSLLHLLVADILDEEEEPARKGEESKGICYIQALHVSTFEEWVTFLLGLVQNCGGEQAFKSSCRRLVRCRPTTSAATTTAQAASSTARPPTGSNNRNRPGFGGRRTHNPKDDTRKVQVVPPEAYVGSGVGSSEMLCNVWTLAVTNLWTLSVAKSLGFQMLDGGYPAMLTRLCLEQGTRLSPLFRIRAAGCAMYMAMKREYTDFFQYICIKNGPSIKPLAPGTAAIAATEAFMTKAKPVGSGHPRYAETLAVTLLHMNDYDLRCYGATCIARLAVSQVQRKKNIVKLGGIDLLIEQLERSTNKEQFTEFATQAILNLSTYKPNQEYICSCAKGVGLQRMLSMVRDPNQPTAAAYAAAVLSNISQHPANRTKLYRAELHSTIDYTYGAVQDQPIKMFDSGIKGSMAKKLAKSSGVNEDGSTIQPSVGAAKNISKSKKARRRFNTWFDSEIAKDMTELQRLSLKKLEGEHGAADESNNRTNAHVHRPMSPRLVSETVRQLKLSSIPVPYKVFSDAAQRNLQAKMCTPLASLWQSNKNVPTVKQLAMAASLQAGAVSLIPGAKNGPALNPTWMDASSRAVLRWAPMIHQIIETDKNEADMKKEGLKLKSKSGRKAELYKHAPPEMTVVLEPRQSPRNQVTFKESGMMSKNRARLAVWTHIQGSKASEGLFPQYSLPNGEKVFFYEHQGMHEAIFPPEMPPAPPQSEESFGAPVPLHNIQAVAPDWENDPPLIRCLPAPKPPPCPKSGNDTHDQNLNQALDKLQTDHVMSFSVAHRTVLSEKGNNIVLQPDASSWRLKDSVFAPRPYESDSRSYWDEAWVSGAAFNVDWTRAIRKQSFRNLICSTHGAGRCAFEPGDEVEVNSDNFKSWYPAIVTQIVRGPTVQVMYSDNSADTHVALSRVRFPGGNPGGFGGRCRRWASPRTEEVIIVLAPESIPDIIGFKGSEIRRMRDISGCKITVRQNANVYSLVASGVPENIKILHELIADIEELALVKQALRHNYTVGLATFNLFRSAGTGDQFAIQETEYDMFVTKCGIVESRSNTCRRHHLSNIFVLVNAKETAFTREDLKINEFNSDASIVRFEFLELIVRVAHAKYGREASGLDECIEMLFRRNIEPFLGTLGEMDHNIFRDGVLYTNDTDQVLKKNLHLLISMFTGYASSLQKRGVRGNKKRGVLMSQPEWLNFLRDSNLITSQFSIVEAKFCFHSSHLLVIDDVNQQDRSEMLTFCSFTEAFCRMTDIMFIPSKAELKDSNFHDFNTYHLNLIKHGTTRDGGKLRRGSVSFVKQRAKKNAASANKHYLHRRHDDERPLSERLQMFFELLEQRGTFNRGSLRKRRRIAAWYADKNYEVTRNASHDRTIEHDIETTAKALHASKPAPKLVYVQKKMPVRPTGQKTARPTGTNTNDTHSIKKKKKKKYRAHTTMTLNKVLDTIAGIWEKKMKADVVDDSVGTKRDSLQGKNIAGWLGCLGVVFFFFSFAHVFFCWVVSCFCVVCCLCFFNRFQMLRVIIWTRRMVQS